MAALLNDENTINASISTESTINTNIPDINYIPGYKVAEEQRRANEIVRQENEADRIALYEDMEAKLESGYFKGDKGDAATISVGTTTTGAAGTNASVTNSGTSSAAVFNFTIPKGDKGDKGEPGEIQFLVVAELPETGTTGVIYLVPITPDTSGNNYAEYIWVNSAWELLGKIGVQVDLTDYVKNTDYATLSKGGVIKKGNSLEISNQGNVYATTLNYNDYQIVGNERFISKGTLENVITGKGLITKEVDNLTNYTKTSSLANVATSGSYNDLLNTPTIPTISDSYGTSTANGYSQNYINSLVGDIDSALDAINGEVI